MSSALEIASRLRADILAGHIAPGQELRQEELAARFAVSRMPVRDALNLLARDRLIALRPNRGGRVVALSAGDIAELYELRLLLELDALRRALERMDAAALERLTLEMRRCELEADTPHFPDADWRFHAALYAPAGRPRQLALIKELRDVCQMHRAAYAGLRRSGARWSEDHRRIVDAVAGGPGAEAEATATAALRAHLAAAGAQLQAQMKRAPDAP